MTRRKAARAPYWQAAGLLITLMACADRSNTDSPTDTVLVKRSAAPKPAGAALPFYLDSAEDCGLLRAQAFADPLALVQRFVSADNHAEFVQSSPLLDSVYACPQHLPGPDEFTVVRSSAAQLLTQNDSQATVLVRSAQIGRMSQDRLGLIFIPEPQAALDTFVVVKTPFGWRILSPQLPGRLLDSVVLARDDWFRLRASVRATLSQARSRP